MDNLVAIGGPTGTGKSRLGIELAPTFNGEIVSADSRQIYRHMDIGTAKPTPEERALVPHHLIDMVNPDEEFSLAQYQKLAYQAIDGIQRRGKLPLLVGGSGLYIWSVLEGWVIPEVPPDPGFRRDLEEKAARSGWEELQRQLSEVDPVAAQRIDPRNVRRVIRALEIQRHAGKPASLLQQKKPPPYRTLIIGLTADRTELYRRVDKRVESMIEQGLLEEVNGLVAMGYGFDLPSMSGIGYREMGAYLRGEITLAEAIEQMKAETHRLIRHQYNWFRLKDSRIKWFDIVKQPESEVAEVVAGFIGESKL